MAMLETESQGAVLVARFNRASTHNPMSLELEAAIRSICLETNDNPEVRALVLTGGDNKSFCAGGDSKEVAQLSGSAAMRGYIDRLIDFYSTILSITKPTVAAVDGYAIGIGLQVALCCDWRIGGPGAKLIMWELKRGFTCIVGGYLLESFLGRAAMTSIVYGCEAVPVSWALDHKLLHEVADSGNLVEAAIARARTLGDFPEITFRRTKKIINQGLIAGLRKLAQQEK
ncbi:enoyl-CoA hydratase/isomerase family protein [Bradyrhizobium sp. USDA 4451]